LLRATEHLQFLDARRHLFDGLLTLFQLALQLGDALAVRLRNGCMRRSADQRRERGYDQKLLGPILGFPAARPILRVLKTVALSHFDAPYIAFQRKW